MRESETEGRVYKKYAALLFSSFPDTHKTHKDFVLIVPSCVTQHHLTEIVNQIRIRWNSAKLQIYTDQA